MIPHSSSGVQPWVNQSRIPSGSRAGDSTGSVALSSAALPDKPSMAAAPPNGHQTVIDLTSNDSTTPESEHPSKRPRLDTNVSGPAGDGKTRSAELRSASASGTPRPATVPGRGRPACSFQELVSETYGAGFSSGNLTPGSQTTKPASPPPFPIRPWKYASSQQSGSGTAVANESTPEREVQTTPYRLEVPSIAPILKGDKFADFSPWTGNHPEDLLSEQTTKQGHYDRTQVSQNESNTARPSLYAQLKHRSGLQVLSSVFAAALEKRQAHNKVASASTFKPPPRVTLTDNKREAWLRDLANPSVPLRRLSRTIPHGIRGKVLLDQCLSKWIPIGRAVWLAKCVGANEIRAFKRKGTSGSLALGLEVKWVRDWTTAVQQFLEGVVSSCGKEDWKMKMTYSVRLTARLFFENLLDQDCYLDWYLSSLENATLDTLPIWLLMLGIYWDHLVRFRKRARRLVELLLEKLRQAITTEPKELFRPLVDRVSVLVRRLCREQTSSVVLPRSWDRYHDVVSSCLHLDDPTENSILQSLHTRNARVRQAKDWRKAAQRSPQQQVIQLLDAARSAHDVSALSDACLGTMADREALVSELLEWTGTPFREGLVRVYIAVRLLRKWKRLGIDVDAHIFSFLAKSRDKFRLQMANIYHVVVELVRSQTFSVGRYLQWLVARGAIERYRQQELQRASSEGEYGSTSQSSTTTSLPGDIELLSQLPVSRLPQHLRNLRDTLLARAGLSLSEEDVTRTVKADIKQRLPAVFRTELSEDDAMVCHTDPSHLSWSVKSEIGQWVRRGVSEHYKDGSQFVADKSSASSVEISSLTPDEFFTVRSTLENFGDLSMLADVLSDAANSDDVLVLASAVDTANRHFDCFSVIGALNDLFKSFFEAFARVKQSGLPLYDLVFSLVELGHRLPNEVNAVVVLRQELARADRKFAMVASSPVSDHMAETLNDTNPSFNDDLEQFLSSGNSMDENTLAMVFQKLSQQLELCDDQGKFSTSTICRYLVQLRSFNPKHFDLLLIRWIEGLLKSSTRPKLSNILAPLVGVGCVTLPAFSAMMKKLMLSESTRSAIPHLAELQLDLLELFVPDANGPSADLLSYRFRMAQEEFLSKHSDEALGIIQNTAACLATQAAQPGLDSVRASLENYTIPLLRHLLVRHPESITQRCVHTLLEHYPATVDVVRRTLNLLLGFNAQPGENNTLAEAEEAINMTNNFSLPFCQLKLQLLFNMEGGEEVKSGIVDIMFKAAVADVRAGQTYWLDLVALMSQDAVQQIRQRAEKGFFSVAQSDSSLEGDSPVERSNLRETARVYLTIIDGLAYSIPEVGVPSVTPLLVEKMNSLLQRLVQTQINIRSLSENRNGTMADQVARSLSVCEENFIFWFTAMLRMITIHRAAFDAPAPSASQRPNSLLDQSRLLITIFCIALSRSPLGMASHPHAGICPSPSTTSAQQSRAGNSLQTYALDVAASLIDTLPDDARQQCARFLRERCPPFLHVHNEPRLMYLLGPVPDFSTTSSSQPVSAPSPATSGPTSSLTPTATPASGSSSIPPSTNAGSMVPTGPVEDPNSLANRLRIQHRGRVVGPYPLRPWEMLEEAAPVAGVNDTAVDLGYFGARRVRD